MRIAVIATVFNEAATVEALVASLVGQTRHPDEVVIVDGGSSDGTPDRLRAAATQHGLPLKLLVIPGANISRGRNAAVAAAASEVIAVTDAGVRLPATWLEELVRPFAQAAEGYRPDVVCGFFAADPQSTFELALGAATLPREPEIDPATFLPSSRSVAFTRTAWAAVQGYPEWLDYCEDLVFDLELKRSGFRFAWAPRAVVAFRPRPSLSTFFRQYYRYARGDGKADLWRKRHAMRYLAYAGAPALAWLGRRQPAVWGLLGLGVAAHLRKPVVRLLPQLTALPIAERVKAIALLPLIVATGDLAKMLGYPVGVQWRLRRSFPILSPHGRTAVRPYDGEGTGA